MELMHAEFDIKPDLILEVLSLDETELIRQRWIDTFCKNRKGISIKNYKWHIFSTEAYPSVSGSSAEEAYLSQQAPEFIVLSEHHESAMITSELPIECSSSDYYVFPKNLAWTMAPTHENGWLGPYFAEHAQYEKLNKINLAGIAKAKAIAEAKSKGWC